MAFKIQQIKFTQNMISFKLIMVRVEGREQKIFVIVDNIIQLHQARMLKQQSTDSYFISESVLYKYEAKKLIGFENTFNQIVFITQSNIFVLNPSEPNKLKTSKKIASQNIVAWRVNKQNHMCILYSDGLLEIRNLERGGDVTSKFNYTEEKASETPPQLYWEDEDIFILYQNKLELLNLLRKQRKTYSDLVLFSQGCQAKGLAQSNLIDRQRIIIMQYSDKLTLNIVPIPITQILIKNVTKMLILSYPKHNHSNADHALSRQYLVLVIQDRILQVYNIISMKQIVEIQYENSGHQVIKLSTDRLKQLLLVTFITKKNKVTKNLLYKINANQYYKGKDYFKQTQNFFQFQIQIDLKEHIMLFPPRQLLVEQNKFVSIDLAYFRHSQKKKKGEVIAAALIINPSAMTTKFTSKHRMRCLEWKQLRQWKDIITSYIQMKNSLDQYDFGFDDEEDEETITSTIREDEEKEKENASKLVSIPQNQLSNIKDYNEVDKKIIDDFNKDTLLLQQHEKQMQKYEKLKNSLLVGAHKFQSQGMALKIGAHEDHDKKLEEQFYKFMREYLREQEIDIDPESFFEFEVENSSQINKPQIQTQPQEKTQNRSKTQNNQERKSSEIDKKYDKVIIASRSTEKLTENKGASSLNRTNESGNQNNELYNNNSGIQNPLFLSSFQDEKNQDRFLSQENIEIVEDFASQSSENIKFDHFITRITQAIGEVFSPLQEKLNKIEAKLERTESIHIAGLKRCQKIMEKQEAQLNNIDMKISGYCQQLMVQFDKNLQSGLKGYWTKIEEMDRKASKNRDKAINDFGLFIDQQIRSREEIFDHNRVCIENSLTHIRKKMNELNKSKQEIESEEAIEGHEDQMYSQDNLDHLQPWR